MGKKAAGRRVQWRFKERGSWVETPVLPTIAELRCYVEPRFPTLVNGLIKVDFQLSSSGGGNDQQGQWFKMVISEDFPSHYETRWHGSNLYFAGSIIASRKLIPTEGSRGDFGVWSHKCSTRKQCGSYMYYICSRTGVAWSVMFELKVHLGHAKKSGACKDQSVTKEGYAVPHAAFFHGVSQKDFWPNLHLWPPWDPNLELPY